MRKAVDSVVRHLALEHMARALALALALAPAARGAMLPNWQHMPELGQLADDDARLDGPAISHDALLAPRAWTAKVPSKFAGATLRDAKKLCGALHDPEFVPFPAYDDDANATRADLPTDFDWREASDCASVSEIRDQSNCGSCWAFGSVEAMTDRTCIQSGGKSAPHLSAQDVTSCCHLGDMGCFGGIPPTAYIYWTTTGVVTGGNYGDASMCYSYEKEPCAHHANSSKYPDCETADIPQRTPACASECVDNGADWAGDKHYGAGKTQYKSVDAMMQDLYANGPITGMFFVKQDFLSYASGVYDCDDKLSPMLGGHAIKILGFGEEAGTPYWLVANSWNEEWGDGGFFKIRRGQNDCQIENFVLNGGPVAGTPRSL